MVLNGVWNDIYEANDYGVGYGAKEKYIQWFAGMNLKGGEMLSRLKRFYEKIDWWMLELKIQRRAMAVYERHATRCNGIHRQ